MARSHMDLRSVTARPAEDIRLAQSSGFIPLTLTLSLGEREQRAMRSGKPTAVGCPPGREGLTLSPRERAGVRGNGTKHRPRMGPIPELSGLVNLPAEPAISQNGYDGTATGNVTRARRTPAAFRRRPDSIQVVQRGGQGVAGSVARFVAGQSGSWFCVARGNHHRARRGEPEERRVVARHSHATPRQ